MHHQLLKSLFLLGLIFIAGCNFGKGMRGPRTYEIWEKDGKNTTDAEYDHAIRMCGANYPHFSDAATAEDRYNRIALIERCRYESGFRLKDKRFSSRGLCGDEKFQHLPACIQWKFDDQRGQ